MTTTVETRTTPAPADPPRVRPTAEHAVRTDRSRATQCSPVVRPTDARDAAAARRPTGRVSAPAVLALVRQAPQPPPHAKRAPSQAAISAAASSLPVGSPVGDRAAEVQAAHGGRGEVVRAERVDHPTGVGGEGGLVAGELDEQRRHGDAGAHRTKSALEESPDQVDSQASGVVSRPKPTRP